VRDPSYGQAYAALAAVYVTLPDWAQASVDTTHPRTVEYARRALALDGALAEARAALGSTYMEQRRFDDAEREYRLAIAADPANTTAHMWYALHLSGRGRPAEALGELRRAHELDPLSPNILGWYAQALATAGRAPEAERRLRALIATEPALWSGYAQLAAVLAAVGRGAEAQAYADTALRLGGAATAKHQYALAVAGLAYARGGRPRDARRTLARVRTLAPAPDPRGVWAHAEAMILVGLGHPDSALAVLRREVDRGHVTMLNFTAITPALVPLHRDPGYADLFRTPALRPGPPR
jgi:tetratricopeptide (TPR) repeat protein